MALVKGDERYIFLFKDDSRAEALRIIGRFAANPELSLTWYDAAVLSRKIRQTVKAVGHQSSRFQLPLVIDPDKDVPGNEVGS